MALEMFLDLLDPSLSGWFSSMFTEGVGKLWVFRSSLQSHGFNSVQGKGSLSMMDHSQVAVALTVGKCSCFTLQLISEGFGGELCLCYTMARWQREVEEVFGATVILV